MHSCTCYLRSTRRSDGLHYLILCLPVRPFSGLVGEESPPPLNLPTFLCGWLLSWVFYFYKVCSLTSLIFSLAGLSAVFNLDSFLRAPLRSWRSFQLFNISNIFGGGSKMVWWTFGHFPCDLVWESIPVFWLFLSCLWFVLFIRTLLANVTFGWSYWSLDSLLMKVLQSFCRKYLSIVSNVPGSRFLPPGIDGNYRVITLIFTKYGNLPLCLENYALFSLPPI